MTVRTFFHNHERLGSTQTAHRRYRGDNSDTLRARLMFDVAQMPDRALVPVSHVVGDIVDATLGRVIPFPTVRPGSAGR